MNSENNELSPILSNIYDIANSGFDVLYKEILENKALNIALYKILDDGFDTTASLEVKTAMNNALALLRTQETTLKALDSSIDNVSDKLMDIVHKYNKNKTEEVFKNEQKTTSKLLRTAQQRLHFFSPMKLLSFLKMQVMTTCWKHIITP